MMKSVTATFQIFEPITVWAENDEQVDIATEMFFANGALTVSVKGGLV